MKSTPLQLRQPGSGNHSADQSIQLPARSESYVAMPQRETTIRDYWLILTKQRWTIIAFAAVVLILTIIATFKTTPIYDAVGRIAINRESSDALPFKDSVSSPVTDEDYTIAMETQVRILHSDNLAMRVIRKLGLDNNPIFTGVAKPQAPAGELPTTSPSIDTGEETKLINTFRNGLKVATVNNTRLIEIHYSSPNPRLAADIVNGIVSSYIEQNYQTKFESAMQTSDWLSRQLADLKLKVETSQEKLIRFQREKGIVGIDEKQNLTTSKLDELSRELTATEADRIQKEANYELAATGNPELMARSPSEMLGHLRERESTLKQEYALLKTQFGTNYPKVVEIKNQLDQLEGDINAEVKRMATQIKNEYLAAQQRENMVLARMEEQKREANELNQNAIEFNILKRDVDANRQLYEGLLQKLKEASLEAGLHSNNIRVVDSARVPLSPVSPDIPRNLGVGLILGLCGGMGLAFLLESLDNTVRTAEQAELASGLPTLGVVPQFLRADAPRLQPAKLSLASSDSTTRRAELIAQLRPNSEAAECYRSLRTSILLSALDSPPKVLLVTSPLPQEGKTTTSVNCAIVLAQRGSRVLLVDADLRRPGVHRAFGFDRKGGLSTVLAGSTTIESVIKTYPEVPNLFILPAGPPPPHPAELLDASKMRSLIADWRKEYDHVIIDTPPALSVTDPVILSVEADSIILVIRSGKTTKDALRRAGELLWQVNARVMGIVVNGIDLGSPDHYYYYYGAKAGGHYYDTEAAAEKIDA
ncbi:MAG TPA: polysaccharide biosynthesis tyrosine autokinase [Candidatus Sulfotelmatobacter sp.]|jgi:exopolysaccharide transport family protein|nr:polysaccharide biosynthesis tyrosine autokinase [Candidatus Sulfotelmatobacter sp.]